jgi:TRAP-type C4-dicarboxylate transport system substrate-binding protein
MTPHDAHPGDKRIALRGAFCAMATVLALLFSFGARAEPVTLKLSFFTSDRTVAYAAAIKPFVDAVNKEGEGVVRIKVYPSGTLGKVQRELPALVLSGSADIAFIIPGQNPERFVDNGVIELPGLFRNVRDATLTYTRLVTSNALAGYQGFFVIGAFATPPETINSRKPIRSLADLKDQKIRVNNPTQAGALAKLGAVPVVMAFNETAAAIMRGDLDGATVPPAQLFDVGIGRLTSYHYLLGTSAAPLTLMMNHKVLDRLPAKAQEIIRKYSGEWAAARFIEIYEHATKKALDELLRDRRRTVVNPSAADEATATAVFKTVADDYAAASPHNAELLRAARASIAKLRAGK